MRARILWTVLLVALLSVAVASSAAATNRVVASSPAASDVVRGPLPTIWLQFDERPPTGASTFELTHLERGDVDLTVSVVDTVATLRFDTPLGPGRFRLEWAVADNGTIRRGVLPFEVVVDGAPDAAPTATASDPTGEVAFGEQARSGRESPLAALTGRLEGVVTWERLREFGIGVRDLALLAAIGGLVFLGLALRGSAVEIVQATRWIRAGAWTAVAGQLATTVGVAASLAVDAREMASMAIWFEVLFTTTGAQLLSTLTGAGLLSTMNHRAGLYPVVDIATLSMRDITPVSTAKAATAAVLTSAERGTTTDEWAFDLSTAPAAQMGAGIMLLAPVMSSMSAHGGSLAVAALAFVHVLAAAVWCGAGTMALLLMGRRFVLRQPIDAPRVVAAAGTLAVAAAALALASGAATWAVTSSGEPQSNTAAQLATAIAAASAATLAVLNRKILAPRLMHSTSRLTMTTRGLLSLEAGLLAVAVAATAFRVV